MKFLSMLSVYCASGFFCFAYNSNEPEITTDSLQIIVNEIAHSQVFEESNSIGIAGLPSKQNFRCNQIKNLASTAQLIELTHNKSAAVRIYSFVALLKTSEVVAPEIIERMLMDKTNITALNGCIATEKTVGMIIKNLMQKYNAAKKA